MSQVRVEQGLLNGNHTGGVEEFLGIPFAAAPVGALRWQPPQPPASWEGALDARSFGATAMQTGGASFDLRVEEMSEDCLFLNVWTTTLHAHANRPVMVWLHGGGNLGGAGSEDAFDGRALAEQGVVVVTLNYRLGAFGYLAHPAIGANFAVLDHVAVLLWVQKNIESFGGDPHRVTIFGESAGAWAVRTLFATPAAKGLFHRAIVQSAGYEDYVFQPAPPIEHAHAAAEEFFDCLGTRDLEELRALPAAEVLRASDELNGVKPASSGVHTPADLTWGPVADGNVVATNGFPGWDRGVPVMLGWVANEARYFIRPGGQYDWADVEKMAQGFAAAGASEVLSLLRESTHDPYTALDILFTTAVWIEPALASLERFAGSNHPVYPFQFSRVSPAAERSGELAQHTSEIRYVFGNLAPESHYDAVDRRLSTEMQEAWTAFAHTGVPRAGGRSWPNYQTDNPRLTVLGNTVSTDSLAVAPLTKFFASQRGKDPHTP